MQGLEAEFERSLKQNVAGYFAQQKLSTKADARVLIKGVLFLLLYLLAYALILLHYHAAITLIAYMVLSVSAVALAVNIGHEAVHGSLSRNKKVNDVGRLTFMMAGVSAFLWQHKHLRFHHRHTNDPYLDTDFQQSAWVRLDDQYPKSRFHSYQHLYIPFFYLLYTFHWTFIKDIKEAISYKDEGKFVKGHNLSLTGILLYKAAYILFLLVIPLFSSGGDMVIVFSFLLSYLVSGLFFGLFLIPIHINGYAAIHDKARSGFVSQLASTPNFSIHNPVLNFLLGGFNHHACHHLFPGISHTHYPVITQILKDLSQQYQAPYIEISLAKLLASHFRHLKNLASA